VVEEKADEKLLGFEYLKPDMPIKPRDPEDRDPDDDGPKRGGPQDKAKTGAPKPRVKRGQRKPRASRQRSVGASLVPKVPLGSK